MLYQSHNPYSLLSETISFDNVQKMGELITLKTLRGSCSYSKYASVLYRNDVNDLDRKQQANYVLSDAYDLAQIAICFLYEFIGKQLDDIYQVKNGKVITIRKATYSLVSRHIQRNYKLSIRSYDIDLYAETLSMEIEDYQEKDYSKVDATIEHMNLKSGDRLVLDCYMGGMSCKEIAEFLDIDRVTVWRRRQRLQVKYKSLFH